MTGSDEVERVHLSVIIPVRNGEPYIANQLRALATQECSYAWELIVVDNGSTDSTLETVRQFSSRLPKLRVITEPLAGRSNALKAGREAVSGEYIVIVDADDEVGAGYLQAMASALDRYELVCSFMETSLLNPWDQGLVPAPDRLVPYLDFLPGVSGALMGVRASAWKRIGDFATDMGLQEDIDFSWRAQLLGVTLGMAPEAVLHWRRPRKAWDNFHKARGYGRGQVRLYRRYRAHGQPRRRIVEELDHLRQAARELWHHRDHWQWRMAWHLGLIAGRLEESLRLRVFYP